MPEDQTEEQQQAWVDLDIENMSNQELRTAIEEIRAAGFVRNIKKHTKRKKKQTKVSEEEKMRKVMEEILKLGD